MLILSGFGQTQKIEHEFKFENINNRYNDNITDNILCSYIELETEKIFELCLDWKWRYRKSDSERSNYKSAIFTTVSKRVGELGSYIQHESRRKRQTSLGNRPRNIRKCSYIMTRKEYIDAYGWKAVVEGVFRDIPPSITLAQGILESGDGNSTIAKEANNHFGIKRGDDWFGDIYYSPTDEYSASLGYYSINSAFRKYKDVQDNYRDHSLFLINHKNYSNAFNYPIDDYRNWAKALKAGGYATAPNYAETLISIIEANGLQEYDKKAKRYKLLYNIGQVALILTIIFIIVKLAKA